MATEQEINMARAEQEVRSARTSVLPGPLDERV